MNECTPTFGAPSGDGKVGVATSSVRTTKQQVVAYMFLKQR